MAPVVRNRFYDSWKVSEKIWAKFFFWVLRFFRKKKSRNFWPKKNHFFSKFFHSFFQGRKKKSLGLHNRHQNSSNMCRNDSQRIFETKKNLCDFGLFSKKFTCPILRKCCFDEKLQNQISPATGQPRGSYFTTL